MADLWAGYRSFAGRSGGGRQRKVEVAKGNALKSSNQLYTVSSTRSSLPDSPPFQLPPRQSVSSYTPPTPAKKSSWGLTGPEMKRRKRVAKYKYYAVEGKVKTSFKKGFRWIKRKCSDFVHGI